MKAFDSGKFLAVGILDQSGQISDGFVDVIIHDERNLTIRGLRKFVAAPYYCYECSILNGNFAVQHPNCRCLSISGAGVSSQHHRATPGLGATAGQ